ncbi:sigma-54-dependent transcriptional regulator [Shewanella sp. 10N.286.48.A6]|uniref:sigma-54-dependent transcriptional regulator n=1 Tax=Shewanella sp. 10N.286.48.A6 TaxID=1880833 RepID=UPI000C843B3F|nr:sigma-54 dependent transcriptional regulator [Shewanella sp. 10N.286.48.A6]PMI00003.1 sigma-54-dependent Fis family transcriptional regulator [Shewanella sp. 10N.286.48.A6]
MDSILVVDDNHAICSALTLMLDIHGYKSLSCETPEQALLIVAEQDISLVIQDMNFTQDTTSGEEGRQLFYTLREQQPNLPIILMTAWTQLETAVELVKAGAADYMGKPWDDAKLLNSISNLLSIYHLSKQNNQLSRLDSERMSAIKDANLCGMVFGSGAMQRCIDLALQVARSDVSVMITGPNGAGKDKIADIVQANSLLKSKPFIKVNIGALPMDLLEAELFGAEAGAFTGANKARIGRFEAADGGTLFLDEIGNLPLSGQVKLLRVLQTGEFERLGSHQTRKVNVRVISATNADLAEDIANGQFREDLFYRLNVIELPIAPLNQRIDDILPLASFFVGETFSFDKQAQQALLTHAWSGNVRELENVCKRAVLLAKSSQLSIADLGLSQQHTLAEVDQNQHLANSMRVDQSADTAPETSNAISANSVTNNTATKTTVEPDKQQIEQALTAHNGVISRVAKALGLSRQALYRRMEKYGLSVNK